MTLEEILAALDLERYKTLIQNEDHVSGIPVASFPTIIVTAPDADVVPEDPAEIARSTTLLGYSSPSRIIPNGLFSQRQLRRLDAQGCPI